MLISDSFILKMSPVKISPAEVTVVHMAILTKKKQNFALPPLRNSHISYLNNKLK